MATSPIYFPRVSALFQPPRITAPQNTSGIQALGSGLAAITDVANNWRQKQQAVEQAKRTADALEKEGMTQEANLYRAAADNFSVNFFATPAENQKFNKGLITDTLSLLEAKQNRELKQAQIEAMAQSRADAASVRISSEARLNEQMKLTNEDRDLARQDRAARNETATLQKQEGIISSQLSQNQQAQNALVTARRKGAISQDEFASQVGPLKDQENKLLSAMDSFQRKALGDNAGDIPSITRPLGRIPTVQSEADEAAALNAEANQYVQSEGKKYPALKTLNFKGKDVDNPFYSGTVSTTTGQDAKGGADNRTTITTPGGTAPAIIGIPTDPTLKLD